MDINAAEALIALNNRFYAEHAASFSATRAAPWDGWRRLTDLLASRGWPVGTDAGDALTSRFSKTTTSPIGVSPINVLDVACGNLRFEQFLMGELPGVRFEFHAVDSCPALADVETLGRQSIQYHEVDVLAAALAGTDALEDLPTCDLSVCFGFMHHVPGRELRRAVLDALVTHTTPGGHVSVSFWQFMNDERLARKARLADGIATNGEPPAKMGRNVEKRRHFEADFRHSYPFEVPSEQMETFSRKIEARAAVSLLGAAQIEANDHFLGWQSDPSPLRYCHHFPETEIDELVASVGTRTREVARYSADGSSGTLNRYLVLERTS